VQQIDHTGRETGLDLPRRSLEALHGLDRRLRRLFLADGTTSLVLGGLSVLAASFLLDYVLNLPREVRLVFLLGGLAALFHFFQRKIAYPLGCRVPREDLANLVERSNPELRQSLITAVELTRGGSAAAANVSPGLLASVVRDVEENVSRIRFENIFDLRRLRKKIGILATVFIVLLGAAVFRFELFSIWFSRNLLLGSERWPKQTLLELVSPPGPFPALVAMGDDLDVVVRVVRGRPDDIVMYSRDEGKTVRSDALSETEFGTFRRLVSNISRPFSFRIAGGDDEIGSFPVEVRLRPRIDMQSIRLWCEYPEYTGIEATPEESPFRHGNLKVPEGTRVRFQMETNVPARQVFLVTRGTTAAETAPVEGSPPGAEAGAAEGAWPDSGAQPLSIVDGRKFSGGFTVRESGQYYFQIEGADGFRSVRPDRFRVEALLDQKPIVKIEEPDRVTEEVSPEASVKVRITASDDYRVKKAVLEGIYFSPGKETGVSQSLEFTRIAELGARPPSLAGDDGGLSGGAGSGGRKAVEDELMLRIASLQTGDGVPPAPGGRFQYFALATDFAGHVGESQVHFLQVVEKDDLLRILSDQLMIVRDQLREALRKQKSARKDLEDVLRQLALRETIPVQEAGKLFRHRQDQQRVSQALEREAADLERIVARSARNRVGDEKWRSWVTGIREDVQEVAGKKSLELEKTIEAVQKEGSVTPQDPSRLNAVAAGQKQLEKDLESIVMRLSEFGDMNAIVQMLRDIRRRQLDLRNEARERTKGPIEEEPQK
jgi:hypothetical protein